MGGFFLGFFWMVIFDLNSKNLRKAFGSSARRAFLMDQIAGAAGGSHFLGGLNKSCKASAALWPLQE